MKNLKVSEMFYSIQGEGPSMGRRAVFLRLATCNLMCGGDGTAFDKGLHDGATWRCDTIEVWMRGTEMTHQTLLDTMEKENYLVELALGAHLIITGGEPLLQQEAIVEFLKKLTDKIGSRVYVEVETNGTISLNDALRMQIRQVNCSPKLSNSGVRKEKRLRFSFQSLVDQSAVSDPLVIFKFVISDEKDALEVEEDFLKFFHIQRRQVWFMPACSTREQLVEKSLEVARLCKLYRVNFSSRLQLEIWDKAVGV